MTKNVATAEKEEKCLDCQKTANRSVENVQINNINVISPHPPRRGDFFLYFFKFLRLTKHANPDNLINRFGR